jgi:hypothetical protein
MNIQRLKNLVDHKTTVCAETDKFGQESIKVVTLIGYSEKVKSFEGVDRCYLAGDYIRSL